VQKWIEIDTVVFRLGELSALENGAFENIGRKVSTASIRLHR